MALIIPPGWLQAVYTFELTGDPEPMVITCGHKIDSGSGGNGPDSPNTLLTAFAANWMSEMSNQYKLVSCTSYVGQDGGSPAVYVSTLGPYPGENSGSVVPQNTAYLIRKRTDVAGKRGRGRFYLPGVRESVVDQAGNVHPDQVTAINLAASNWYDDLTSSPGLTYYPPYVLHRSEGIGIEPAPSAITSFRCENIVATQRRRLRR